MSAVERLVFAPQASGLAWNRFRALFASVEAAEGDDPRPEASVSDPVFVSWQERHWQREWVKSQVHEADSLTRDGSDPCPLTSEGLSVFLAWSRRQEERRQKDATP